METFTLSKEDYRGSLLLVFSVVLVNVLFFFTQVILVCVYVSVCVLVSVYMCLCVCISSPARCGNTRVHPFL